MHISRISSHRPKKVHDERWRGRSWFDRGTKAELNVADGDKKRKGGEKKEKTTKERWLEPRRRRTKKGREGRNRSDNGGSRIEPASGSTSSRILGTQALCYFARLRLICFEVDVWCPDQRHDERYILERYSSVTRMDRPLDRVFFFSSFFSPPLG